MIERRFEVSRATMNNAVADGDHCRQVHATLKPVDEVASTLFVIGNRQRKLFDFP